MQFGFLLKECIGLLLASGLICGRRFDEDDPNHLYRSEVCTYELLRRANRRNVAGYAAPDDSLSSLPRADEAFTTSSVLEHHLQPAVALSYPV